MAELQGKVALVTGAASGIGRAVAELFAAEGAQLLLTDIDAEAGEKTRKLLQDMGAEARFVRADVSVFDECQALVQQAVAAFGRLDVACNNAGVSGEQNLTADYSPEGWQTVLGVNLSGVFYGMKSQIPAMLRGGGGSIVNVASILGHVGFATASAYVAAKHGVVGLTRNAAIEYAAQGVRANAVAPGFIRTPMIADLDSKAETHDMLVSLHPMGRLGDASEVAQVVLFLASSRASFVTGACYAVDGGYLAR